MDCPACRHSFETGGNPTELRTVVCPSCSEISRSGDGSSFTASGEKVKAELGDRYRIKLGRKGKLKGKEWTVTGRLRYDWEDDGDTGYVLEYVLFNDYEGYAWLDEERGHFLFGRPVDPESGTDLFAMPPKPVKILGKNYRFLERGELTLAHFDGAIPWEAEPGEEYRYAEAVAPPFVLSEERTEGDGGRTEIEFSESEYLNQTKTAERFKTKWRPKGPHPAQAYQALAGEKWIKRVGVLGSILIFFSFCYTAFQGEPLHKEKLRTSALIGQEYLSEPFTIRRANETLEIDVYAGINNHWIEYGVALFAEETQSVIAAEDGYFEYYSGYEGGEHWTEGSRRDSLYWKVKQPGDYRLLLKIQKTDAPSMDVPFKVTVHQKVRRAYLLFLLGLVWPILPIYLHFRRRNFEKRRFADV